MVRLKEIDANKQLADYGNFNSSMVRLKARFWWEDKVCTGISIPVWYDWKFHTQTTHLNLLWISIPVWYDWKLDYRSFFYVLFVISIPVWYDWKSPCPQIPTQCRWISIPVWYDWKGTVMNWIDEALLFQFQYGTIESSSTLHEAGRIAISIPVWYDWKFLFHAFSKSASLFQFQYGTIESTSYICHSASAVNFNSSMVRLKDHSGTSLFRFLSDFNSSMVRLKEKKLRRTKRN